MHRTVQSFHTQHFRPPLLLFSLQVRTMQGKTWRHFRWHWTLAATMQ